MCCSHSVRLGENGVGGTSPQKIATQRPEKVSINAEISFAPADQLDRSGQGDIAIADVAAVCVSALSSQHSKGVTLEILSQPKIKPGPGDMDCLFNELKSDVLLASNA
jgi:hypothetical protein